MTSEQLPRKPRKAPAESTIGVPEKATERRWRPSPISTSMPVNAVRDSIAEPSEPLPPISAGSGEPIIRATGLPSSAAMLGVA